MGTSTARLECAPVARGERRRREIALVAEAVFFENGFAETTMQQIAARAGASKETLYRHFGSKEGLFAEIVSERASSFLASVDANFDRPGSLEEVLRAFGTRMLEAILMQDATSLCRTVISELPRNPELGALFFSRGPERVRERLAAFLAAAAARGELDCDDCDRAARIFVGAAVGGHHLSQLVLHEPTRPTHAEIEAYIDAVVTMFMKTYGR